MVHTVSFFEEALLSQSFFLEEEEGVDECCSSPHLYAPHARARLITPIAVHTQYVFLINNFFDIYIFKKRQPDQQQPTFFFLI